MTRQSPGSVSIETPDRSRMKPTTPGRNPAENTGYLNMLLYNIYIMESLE